jgi:hypothetical protein
VMNHVQVSTIINFIKYIISLLVDSYILVTIPKFKSYFSLGIRLFSFNLDLFNLIFFFNS